MDGRLPDNDPVSASSDQPRFILDVHLGKLAYHLRMLGFDTIYRANFDDNDLIRISASEWRSSSEG